MSDPQTIQAVSANLASNFEGLRTMLSSLAYIAGIGFGLQAALAFKRHNEQPETTPISQPITLMAVAAVVLALPELLASAGSGTFGSQVAQAPAKGATKTVALAKADAPKAKEVASKAGIKAEASQTQPKLASGEELAGAQKPVDDGASKPEAQKPAVVSAPKPGLSEQSFAAAQEAAAREMRAKGLSAQSSAASSSSGDGSTLGWVLGALAALGAGAGAWARKAAKRIGREKQAQALPEVNLNAGPADL